MSFGAYRTHTRARARHLPRLEAAATYLDDHVLAHYRATFLGVAADVPGGRLRLLARDPADPECRSDAARWLGCFGPDFLGFPLDLDTAPGARP